MYPVINNSSLASDASELSLPFDLLAKTCVAFNSCLAASRVDHSVFGLFLHLDRTYLALFRVLCVGLVLHFVVLKSKLHG